MILIRVRVHAASRGRERVATRRGGRGVALWHAHTGQALERNGHAFIGLKVFEKRPGARLHAHALYHIAKRCMGVIENAVDVFERKSKHGQKGDVPTHARPATANDLDYVLKQRRWAGPDIEHNRPRRLLYARLSFTKYAEAMVWPKPKIVAKPLTWTFEAGGQGLLFSRLPDTDTPQRERVPVTRPKIEPSPMLRLFSVVDNVDVLAAMRGLGPGPVTDASPRPERSQGLGLPPESQPHPDRQSRRGDSQLPTRWARTAPPRRGVRGRGSAQSAWL